ncbi:MAG: hypothetical protein ACR2QF_04775 [Geminicoccaceae bacterium]
MRPLVGGDGITCVALRRGPEVMALFRGCPLPSAIASLQELRIAVGIAISADELRTIEQLDCYRYVFVAVRSQAALTLKLAVTDLARRNWAKDDTTTVVAVSTSTPVFGS